MRLKFLKTRFIGTRTFAPGEVAEVPDDLGPDVIKEGDAQETTDDVTPIPEPAADPEAPDTPPDDKKKKK